MSRAIEMGGRGPIQPVNYNPHPEGPWRVPVSGNPAAPIVVLCDTQTDAAFALGSPMGQEHEKFFWEVAQYHGLSPHDIACVGLAPPIPYEDRKSASRRWKHVEAYQEQVRAVLSTMAPSIIVTFGELATRVMLQRSVKITKARGVVVTQSGETPVLPMLSPGFVTRIPDHIPIFSADIGRLGTLKKNSFQIASLFPAGEVQYAFARHRSVILDFVRQVREMEHPVISVDTEGTGLRWWDPDVELLTVQLCMESGKALMVPVCEAWQGVTQGAFNEFRAILKDLLEDPEVRKIGHNIKFEHMMCRKIDIEIQGWLHDTQLMLFNVDENMFQKDLDSGVRIYVPEMSGYADLFNQTYDKSRMWDVPIEDMVTYGCGDADATLRLAQRLRSMIDADPRQRRIYRRVQMPAIMAFANTIEPHGLLVDQQKLEEFGGDLRTYVEGAYKSLIKRVPAAVRRKHVEQGKELKFSRDDFIRDILFSEDGFNLTPIRFTDTTADLLDETKRVPSVSSKNHLPYFLTNRRRIRGGGTVGDFIQDLRKYQRATKMLSTYVGEREANTGFWKYLSPASRIHPSYMLHRTNTGRTASADPNGQNLPQRGDFAKQYKKCFVAPPGWVLVSCDLSQIELRLVAWMAGEQTMLQIYREGGDIHRTTAASVMGISPDEFSLLPTEDNYENNIFSQSTLRFRAKAVNFGIVYGMSALGFQRYAKTDYEIDYTEAESYNIRDTYFSTYPGLPVWHETMKAFVRSHGYVRSLHGAVRHLPSINSDDEGIRAAAERYAVNSPIQRFGSDLGVIGFTRMAQQAPSDIMRLNGFVHDAVYMEVREDYAQEAAASLKWVMENPPLQEWFGLEAPLPIVADATVAGEEMKGLQAWRPDWWDDDEVSAAARYNAARPEAAYALMA